MTAAGRRADPVADNRGDDLHARSPRRRRHGRPHLAAARHRRRPAPPRPRLEVTAWAPRAGSRCGWSPRRATRSSWSRRCRCRAGRRSTCCGCPPGCGARSARRSTWSTGSAPTWWSASAATSGCRPTSRPGAAGCRWSCTRGTRCPASPTSWAPGSPTHVATSFPDTPLRARGATSACRSAGWSPPSTAARCGPRRAHLRPRREPAHAAGHRRVAGRPAAQPVGRGRATDAGRGRRAGAARRRARTGRPRAPLGRRPAVRRRPLRRPDGPRLRRRRPGRLPRRREHRDRGGRGRAAGGLRAAADRQRRAGRSTPVRWSTPAAGCSSPTRRSPRSGWRRPCPALLPRHRPARGDVGGRGRADPARRRRAARRDGARGRGRRP